MKTLKPKKGNFIMNVLQEKCPNCGEGHVYEKSRGIFTMPVMKEKCEVCNYRFDREPGYFLGAMYISYAFAVLQGIITFLICLWAFPDMETIWRPIIILGVILLFAKKNYKLSRIVYMHLFPW